VGTRSTCLKVCSLFGMINICLERFVSVMIRSSLQYHTTMDSDVGQATLNRHRAPCGWMSRRKHLKTTIGREGLRATGLNCAFEVPMLVPHSDKRPSVLFACLEAPSLSNTVPRNTVMDVTIRPSRFAARRRHAAERP
jgi:hypothetical protein